MVGATRTPGYLDALGRLDSCAASEIDVSELAGRIGEAFGIGETAPLGCVARCYLGPPYQVHTLDLVGCIVEHYHASQPLPGEFERARRLAMHPAYIAVEVYSDHLVCVRADGATVLVNQ
ncbi:MAG: hypothetical protein ACRDJ3_05805 [Solirubrobacteraceae bacterium]